MIADFLEVITFWRAVTMIPHHKPGGGNIRHPKIAVEAPDAEYVVQAVEFHDECGHDVHFLIYDMVGND